MRVQRAIRVIMSALLMVTLCFCMIGCKPSEEEVKLANMKTEVKIKMDALLQNTKQQLYNEYLVDIGNNADSLTSHYELMYALATGYMEENVTLYKAKIDKIEDEKEFDDSGYAIYRDLYNHFAANLMNYLKTDWFSHVQISPTIKTESDDGIEYKIESTFMPVSSHNEYYIKFDSNDKELEANFYAKVYKDCKQKEYKQTVIAGKVFRFDNEFEYDSGYMEIYIVVIKNGEIIGYTLLSGYDIDVLKVKKSAAIKSSNRAVVTNKKVTEYLGNDGTELEERDGVKLTASNVDYNLGYYVPGKYSVMKLRQVSNETSGVYNEIEFDKNYERDDETFECWLDDGEVDLDGENVKLATINQNKKQTLRWNAGAQGMLNIVEKRNGEIISFILISTEILEDSVYDNIEQRPVVFVACSLYNFFGDDEYKINTEQHFNSYVKTIKRYEGRIY